MSIVSLHHSSKKAAVLAQLQKELLPLQGFHAAVNPTAANIQLGPVNHAFPNQCFPTGAIHEFIAASAEQASATTGFMAGILSQLMGSNGVSLWISHTRSLFPPGLNGFGIAPEKIIFLDIKKEKEIGWAMEEALKCGALSAVIGEIPELSFTASRRLQLAVEQSQVTGFVLRRSPRQINTTACVTRWRITHLPSEVEDELPGVGFPAWNIELLKVRNGKPGTWSLLWKDHHFCTIESETEPVIQPITKTG